MNTDLATSLDQLLSAGRAIDTLCTDMVRAMDTLCLFPLAMDQATHTLSDAFSCFDLDSIPGFPLQG